MHGGPEKILPYAFLSKESCLQCHSFLQIFIKAQAEAHAQEQLALEHFIPERILTLHESKQNTFPSPS